MQDSKETGSAVMEQSRETTAGQLSEQLSRISELLTPKEFRAEFGLRFNALLGATGLDWRLASKKKLEEAKPDPQSELTLSLQFPKAERYLILSRALSGLPDSVTHPVMDAMLVLSSDWCAAIEADVVGSQSSQHGEPIKADQFAVQLNATSPHLPEFLPARLVHKLRNYLTPIISGAGQIKETARLEGTTDHAAMAELVVSGGRDQEKLLERFMLTYGPLDIQRAQINLTDLIQSIVSGYRSRGHRSINIGELPNEVLCYQDDNFLRTIYGEVIDNALEAGGDDPIAISFSYDKNSTSLQIVNSGTATVDEVEKQFFKPFYSHKPGHNGLGLSLARRLAREMEGDLRSSTTTDAICFEVTIPRNLNKF